MTLWKKARQLKIELKILTQSFPQDEKYRLTNQIVRASRGVGACIAEGHGRFSYKDQIHFCILARGSLSEIFNHLIDAYDEELIIKAQLDEFNNKIIEVQKYLNGYITWLRKQITK
ncbi:MAG: four helix bundle protein [Pedobacter sp.]|nr:MAG: four helix bundle protein [Pedobacter sp.]